MNRKLKIFGLALVVALALTAVMASAASAQFTYDYEHTILSGSQKTGTNDVFSAGEGFGGITCQSVTFSGTSTGKSEHTQALSPTYSNCKDSLGRSVDVDNSNFTLGLTSGRTLGETKGYLQFSGGLTFTITSGGAVVCTMSLKNPQTAFLPAATYLNLAGGSVELIFKATGLDNTTSGGFFNCGMNNGEHFSGTYEGKEILTGKSTSGAASWILVD